MVGCGHRCLEKYDAAGVRNLSVIFLTAIAALALSACGTESVSVPESDTVAAQGGEIFATYCSGCHTIGAAGTEGSGNRNLRVQGPNFDQRKETYDDALFAIHNGGFSGAIMPQNIVVGDQAEAVAKFLAAYSGSDVDEPPRPSTEDAASDAEAENSDTSGGVEQTGDGSDDQQIQGDPEGGSGSNPNTGD